VSQLGPKKMNAESALIASLLFLVFRHLCFFSLLFSDFRGECFLLFKFGLFPCFFFLSNFLLL